MNTEKFVRLLMLICAVFGSWVFDAAAVGLRTPLGQVSVSGLKIGKSYSLKELIGRTYELINTGDDPLQIRVESQKPRSSEMIPNTEPIPDPAWVAIERSRFTLGPSQVAKSDLVITIPKDEKHLGKRYLVMIQGHTEGKASIQFGLRSRMVLEISSTPPSVDELRAKLAKPKYKNLSFDLSPYEAVAENFPLGRRVNLLKDKNIKLKLINPNDEALTVHLQRSTSQESQFPIPSGMLEGPDGSVFEIEGKDGIYRMEPNSLTVVPLFLEIPSRKEFRGKTFYYLMKAEILEQEVPTVIYFRLAVRMAK